MAEPTDLDALLLRLNGFLLPATRQEGLRFAQEIPEQEQAVVALAVARVLGRTDVAEQLFPGMGRVDLLGAPGRPALVAEHLRPAEWLVGLDVPTASPGNVARALLLAFDVLGWPCPPRTPGRRGSAAAERVLLESARGLPASLSFAGASFTAGEFVRWHTRPATPKGAVYRSGVRFAAHDSGLLHLYRRANRDERAPGVLFVHGGGWESGGPAAYLRAAAIFAERGWVAASCGYRLLPLDCWPAQPQDVESALRWLSANAPELGLDSDRLVLVGDSAGAHLSAWLAADPPADLGLSGAFLLSPLTDTEWPDLVRPAVALVERLAGGTPLRELSPVHRVSARSLPMKSLVGSLDPLTTPAMVEAFHARLTEHGVRNDVEVLEGRTHAFEFDPTDGRLWIERAARWLTALTEV